MSRINLSVGRQRVLKGMSPSQAGYIQHMRRQMNAVVKNMEKVIAGIEGASPEALLYATKPIFDTSQQLVPVDTGALKRSGFHEARRSYRGSTVAIGYGRGGTPSYAPIVHERMDLNHASPTQAKFLQEAVYRHVHQITPRYAEFIKHTTGLSD